MLDSTRFPEATHRAELAGQVLFLTVDSYDDACERLRSTNEGVPVIVPLDPEADRSASDGSTLDPTALMQPVPRNDEEEAPTRDAEAGEVSASGAARSQTDADAATAAGFAPKQPLYTRGTRVVEWGVENAKTKRAEFDAMPPIVEVCDGLIETVAAEKRRVVEVQLAGTRFDSQGGIALPGTDGPGKGRRYQLDDYAFRSLVSRMGLSGARYLAEDCSPKLRAINMNHHFADAEVDDQLRLLMRRNPNARGGHEVFGVVGSRYQEEFHAGRIAEGVAKAMATTEARGSLTYDGRRTKIQALFHSTVEPEEYVAGEFFRAGIQVRTDDTGGGSCIVEAVVWQNLCLNLIVIDQAVSEIANIIHVGDLSKLEDQLAEAMVKAQAAIGHFVKAWGYATHDDVIAEALKVIHDQAAKRELEAAASGAVPIEEVIPGFYAAMRKRELVPLKRRDVHKDKDTKRLVAPDLVEAFKADASAARVKAGVPLSRAALVNAVTRHAHTTADGTFAEDGLEAAAGKLLFGRNRQSPAPLPYQAVGLDI